MSRAARRRRRAPAQLLFLAGLPVGICLGLIIAWASVPPDPDGSAVTLRGVDAASYAALVALAWSVDEDRERASERLGLTLPDDSDPEQHMAEMACRLAATDYVDSAAGRVALRSMRNFYQAAGHSACADNLLPAFSEVALTLPPGSATPMPSATFLPPPSKTPAPTPAPLTSESATPAAITLSGTATALRPFAPADLSAFCDAERPALLLVTVQERDGRGIPGMELRVRWVEGEDRFFSGLKPEQGLAHADFAMAEGKRYRIDMPGRAEASREFATGPCEDDGVNTLRSWRADFLPAD